MTSISSNRRAAIIGAGQTGVTAALGLLDAGFDVTVYSDRGQEGLRNDVPATGTAVIFKEAQDAEKSLGLDSYLDVAPSVTGMSGRLVVGPDDERLELLDFDSNFNGFQAVGMDVRVKVDDRLTAFRERGGRFVVDAIDPVRLDPIAAANDLTLVSTGKGGLASLFPIDLSRTAYSRPQRKLLMITVSGLGHGPDVFAHRGASGGSHNALTFIAEHGEAWWGPYFHKDAGPSWSFLAWAKPGSPWEARFDLAVDAETAWQVVLDLHRDYLPRDLPEAATNRVIVEDPHSWLKGAITPVVRTGLGHTANGHSVVSLGDSAISYDPIGAQGAQNGLIQAAQLIHAARDHERAFDDVWIAERFEAFYASRASAGYLLTRLFLNDPELAAYGNLFFPAAAVSPRFAAALFGLISSPQALLDVTSEAAALRFISEQSGEDAAELLARFVPTGPFRQSELGFTTSVR